jgi:hypothetical protein
VLRFLALLFLLLAVLVSGCTVGRPTLAAVDRDCAGPGPLHVVVGVSGQGLSTEARRAALGAVLEQLKAQLRLGAPGLVLSAYALTENSVNSDGLRLRLGCVPAEPLAPDLKQAPTFQRAELLKSYRAAQANAARELQNAQRQLDVFGKRLLALQPSTAPTDIWGFLALAAHEFDAVDAGQRHVILVARDEIVQTTYCDGCHPLRAAQVHFLAFDQPSASDQQRRRNDWAYWLQKVGAGRCTFSRSNEPVPPLFVPGGVDVEDKPHA